MARSASEKRLSNKALNGRLARISSAERFRTCEFLIRKVYSQMEIGRVVKIAGPLVVAEGMSGANMFDVVRVGPDRLIGEMIVFQRTTQPEGCDQYPDE